MSTKPRELAAKFFGAGCQLHTEQTSTKVETCLEGRVVIRQQQCSNRARYQDDSHVASIVPRNKSGGWYVFQPWSEPCHNGGNIHGKHQINLLLLLHMIAHEVYQKHWYTKSLEHFVWWTSKWSIHYAGLMTSTCCFRIDSRWLQQQGAPFWLCIKIWVVCRFPYVLGTVISFLENANKAHYRSFHIVLVYIYIEITSAIQLFLCLRA